MTRDQVSRVASWAIALLATVALSLSAWSLSSVVEQGREIATLKAEDANETLHTRAALLRLESKLDRLLEGKQER